MCGICGWWARTGEPPPFDTLQRMLGAISHRGPDEQGHYNHEGLTLGMTRLAINDIDGGAQPYYSEDRKVVAVFNGEIYNFKELRKTLEARGHQFRSQTDGEVIVHLFEEHGVDMVGYLNGMFAIALWDGSDLYLFRDRFGIKPLYYTEIDGVFCFGSELKVFLEMNGFSRRLDHQALRTYLTMEYVAAPRSIFAGTQKLPPAHFLKVGAPPRRYWNFPTLGGQRGSLESWGERLRDELRDSVRRRLVADVPLGVFLSGGLDSSSVAALMTELSPGKIQTFSVGFEEKSFDESSFARQVARELGTEHHEHILTSEATLEVVEPLYQRLDEPLADAAIIPTYLLSRFARQHVTVALAGEGADELLGGYPTYFAHQLSQPLNRLPRLLLDLGRRMVSWLPTSRRYLSLDFKLKKFFSGLGLADVERHLTWMGSFGLEESHGVLAREVEHALNLETLRFEGELVERIQTLDFHTYLADDLLVKLDRATMMVSLEGRVPYLDHQLVEAMSELPLAHKFSRMDAKRVLKAALGQRLPSQVVRRKKKGFGIPIADWLRGPLKFMLDEHLNPNYLRHQGLFNPGPVQRLVAEHLSGRVDHRKPLWTLLVFQLWFRQFRPVL